MTPDDQIMKSFPAPDVAVTALHFEKRCTSLFIGFSFGQFHILDLQELALRLVLFAFFYRVMLKKNHIFIIFSVLRRSV